MEELLKFLKSIKKEEIKPKSISEDIFVMEITIPVDERGQLLEEPNEEEPKEEEPKDDKNSFSDYINWLDDSIDEIDIID